MFQDSGSYGPGGSGGPGRSCGSGGSGGSGVPGGSCGPGGTISICTSEQIIPTRDIAKVNSPWSIC